MREGKREYEKEPEGMHAQGAGTGKRDGEKETEADRQSK